MQLVSFGCHQMVKRQILVAHFSQQIFFSAFKSLNNFIAFIQVPTQSTAKRACHLWQHER